MQPKIIPLFFKGENYAVQKKCGDFRYQIKQISFFAIFLSLSIVLKKLSFFSPILGIKIGFDSIPYIMVGWWLGAIPGFAFGILGDVVGYFAFPSIFPYSWIFSLQAGGIGLVAGMLGNKRVVSERNLWIAKLICSFGFISFLIVCWYFFNYGGIFLVAMIGFILVFEICFQMCASSRLVLIVFINSFIWSFLLGPAMISYYLGNFQLSSAYEYYLIPRIIKECLKTPLLIVIISYILYACE